MLRLFNDCFAVAGLWLAIYAYQRRRWLTGSVLYSLAVGVKMSVLLALPAVAIVLLQGHFLAGSNVVTRALRHAIAMLAVQVRKKKTTLTYTRGKPFFFFPPPLPYPSLFFSSFLFLPA